MDLKRIVGIAVLAGGLVVSGAACTDDDAGDETEPVGGSGDDTIPIGEPEPTEAGDG
jgi:hypothetical protein